MIPPINFKEWINKNREMLRPPVCNKVVYQDTEFIIMVVGGPNSRKDYHVDEGEEFFYQIEGDMTLRIMDSGKPKDITIFFINFFLEISLFKSSLKYFGVKMFLTLYNFLDSSLSMAIEDDSTPE